MPPDSFFPHKISGLIIAGGMSSRFQIDNKPWRDKALVRISDKENLLQRTILLLANLCEEILIVVKNSFQKNQYFSAISILDDKIQDKISIIEDNSSYVCTGPTLGILTGLEAARNDYMLISPVDMPFISETIFQQLVNNLEDSSMIVPYWSSTGKIEPLVAAVNVRSTLANAKLLSIIRRSRADDIHRLTPKIRFLPIQQSKSSSADVIFTSMNEQEMRPTSNAFSKHNDILGNIFDSGQSFTVTNNFTKDNFDEIFDQLRNQQHLKISQKELEKIVSLSKKYFKRENYFVAGIILFNLLDFIPNDAQNKDSIHQLCLHSFLKEAEKWNKNKIAFLELHSIVDAQSVLKESSNEQQTKELTTKTIALKEKMKLKKKNHKKFDMASMLLKRSSKLLEKAKQAIQKSENDFNEKNSSFESNFLWDHSYRVGKIAYKIALMEGINPIIPTLAAIFHDAGKFVLGSYHADELPEEAHSASIAEKILQEEGFSQQEIKDILAAISALYNDQMECNKACKIVHDADRLEKLGFLGIANFFTKATLRGKNLTDAIIGNLSRELTYVNAAPKTMLTESGRMLATEKKEQTFDYFQGLLDELVFFGIGKYYLKKKMLENGIEIFLIIPENCFQCDGLYQIALSTERGIKCEKLITHYSCTKCSDSYEISFCLPIIDKT